MLSPDMSTQTTAPRLFKDKLRHAMDTQAIGITDLARRFHPDSTSKEFESQRRLIHKHLSGAKPSRVTRRRYERILGLEQGSLDSEDPEADPVTSFLDGLMKRVDERVDQLVAKTSNATAAPLSESAAVASTTGG